MSSDSKRISSSNLAKILKKIKQIPVDDAKKNVLELFSNNPQIMKKAS